MCLIPATSAQGQLLHIYALSQSNNLNFQFYHWMCLLIDKGWHWIQLTPLNSMRATAGSVCFNCAKIYRRKYTDWPSVNYSYSVTNIELGLFNHNILIKNIEKCTITTSMAKYTVQGRERMCKYLACSTVPYFGSKTLILTACLLSALDRAYIWFPSGTAEMRPRGVVIFALCGSAMGDGPTNNGAIYPSAKKICRPTGWSSGQSWTYLFLQTQEATGGGWRRR